MVKGLTKDDIMLGTSILRNKKLANVFYRLKWIEAYGTGILKIKEAYETCDLKPIIDISDNAFKVTLPAIKMNMKQNKTDKKLNTSERSVLEMIELSNLIKRSDVQKKLNISQPMAIKILKNLLEQNAIVRVGAGKNVMYKANTNLDSFK